MQKVICSTMAMLGVSFGAQAADLPMNYKGAPVASAYSWTGFYTGLNAGYVWGDANISAIPHGTAEFPFDPQVQSNGFDKLSADGFTGGVQFGYNYQVNRALIGIEADFDFLSLKASRTRGPFRQLQSGGFPFAYSESIRANWLATVGPRFGYLINPTLLIYATGGLAVAHETFTDELNFNSGRGAIYQGITTTTRYGWTVGGGLEHAFTPNWSYKVEYKYADLGNTSVTALNNFGDPTFNVFFTSRLPINTVRVGVNYKLGDFAP